MKETYNEMMHRRTLEYEEHKNDPKPETTTCKNFECPLHDCCKHSVWKDGLKCLGNDIGRHYQSSQQAIYGDYVRDCKRLDVEPMSRFHFFEFGVGI